MCHDIHAQKTQGQGSKVLPWWTWKVLEEGLKTQAPSDVAFWLLPDKSCISVMTHTQQGPHGP